MAEAGVRRAAPALLALLLAGCAGGGGPQWVSVRVETANRHCGTYPPLTPPPTPTAPVGAPSGKPALSGIAYSVTVDGVRTPDWSLQGTVNSVSANARAYGVDLDGLTIARGAVAEAVSLELLLCEAHRVGLTVDPSEVNASLQQALTDCQNDLEQCPAYQRLTPGQTLVDAMSGPAAQQAAMVSALREKERRAVYSASPGVDQRTAIVNWLTDMLKLYSVEVDGLAQFSIPDAYDPAHIRRASTDAFVSPPPCNAAALSPELVARLGRMEAFAWTPTPAITAFPYTPTHIGVAAPNVVSASVSSGQSGEVLVELTLDPAGTQAFQRATQAAVGAPGEQAHVTLMAGLTDDQINHWSDPAVRALALKPVAAGGLLLSDPEIQEPILDGHLTVSGIDPDVACALVSQLNPR
ncbi:MAG: SecDF P1 head subdomain-containing protein [Candidatus Dormibacteria bacterium]